MKARGSQERSSPSLQSLAQSPDAAKTEVDSEGSDVSYLTVLSEEHQNEQKREMDCEPKEATSPGSSGSQWKGDRPKKEETEKPTTQKTQRGPRRRWWSPGAGGSLSDLALVAPTWRWWLMLEKAAKNRRWSAKAHAAKMARRIRGSWQVDTGKSRGLGGRTWGWRQLPVMF